MAHDSYKDWRVTGYTRDAVDHDQDGQPFPLGYKELVTVVFDGTHRYGVVLDDAGQITELTIGGPISPALLRRLPLGYLAEAARGFQAAYGAAHAEGYPQEAALAEAAAVEVAERDGPPTPEAFAAQWLRTPPSVITAEGRRVTRRQALADRYAVSVWSIDKWSRAARDRGLIGKDRPGAPSRAHTSS